MTHEFLATYRSVFLNTLKEELKNTRKVIAAIPNDHLDYRPDPKSKTALELAWHIVTADLWFLESIIEQKFTSGATPPLPAGVATGKEIAAWHEEAMTNALPKLEAMSGEQLAVPVDFMGMFTLPAALYLQFMNNHTIHHRGQLATYLRPMGGKCPSIYGPSADENPFA
ncbi:DinB family protein [Bryobacter aggregatus]|uniref:DinB family protein n=1 Tax=Bryobacter aggregatus TaxID=360054 RepID=UPI0004E0DED9|nr:DinB family protein [Bryobacter aggregatus]